MKNYRRIAAIVLRHFYLLRGSPARLLPLFAWVAVDILLWGFITRYLNSVTGSALNFISMLLGAVLLWDFFTRVMHGVAAAFFEDVWARNFLNVFATPLSIAQYLTGLVTTSIVTSMIGLAVMLILATTVFGLSYFTYGLLFFPFLGVLFFFGIALGIFGCALVLRFGPASEWLIWPVPALLSPFAGVFYPLATLPCWMQWVSHLLPPAYVFEGMRRIVAGGTVSGFSLAWSLSLAIAYIFLACGYFASVYHHTQRTGLLARYSAETLN